MHIEFFFQFKVLRNVKGIISKSQATQTPVCMYSYDQFCPEK